MEHGSFVVSYEFDFQVGKTYRHCVDMGEFVLTGVHGYSPGKMGEFTRKRYDFEEPSIFVDRDKCVYPLSEMKPY